MTFRYGKGERLTAQQLKNDLAYKREDDQAIVKQAEDAGILQPHLCKCCGRDLVSLEAKRTGFCFHCAGSLNHRGECVLCQMRRQGLA